MMICRKALRKGWGWALAAVLVALGVNGVAGAASETKTIAEIALYQGPDREKMLIEGAKKEGQLTFYNSNTWLNTSVAQGFEKKYPFIKVSAWRSDGPDLFKRTVEENAAGRFLADVFETSSAIWMLQKAGILQEFYSPQLRYYTDEMIVKGKNGASFCADRETYYSLGFNTKAVSPTEAPKAFTDFLDSKWNGKMSLAGGATGVRWIGVALDTMGREFIEKLSRQNIRVQNVSGAALATMIVSGEVPLSPTGSNFNLDNAKKKGAPVEWRPLEPVLTDLGCSGMSAKAPHPYAALLFLDYLYSAEGQTIVKQGGLSSPRDEKKFKKTCPELKYPNLEEYEKKYNEWEGLMQRLFVRKRS